MGIAISEKLSLLRKKSGKTQKEVAADLNIAPSALSSYEQGKSSPPLDLAVRIAQYFGASLDWLCDIKTNSEPYTRTKVLKTITELCENVRGLALSYDLQTTPFEDQEVYNYRISLYLDCGEDPWAYSFFERYEKLLELVKSGDIDTDVIEAWKAKKYSENNVPVDELPF